MCIMCFGYEDFDFDQQSAAVIAYKVLFALQCLSLSIIICLCFFEEPILGHCYCCGASPFIPKWMGCVDASGVLVKIYFTICSLFPQQLPQQTVGKENIQKLELSLFVLSRERLEVPFSFSSKFFLSRNPWQMEKDRVITEDVPGKKSHCISRQLIRWHLWNYRLNLVSLIELYSLHSKLQECLNLNRCWVLPTSRKCFNPSQLGYWTAQPTQLLLNQHCCFFLFPCFIHVILAAKG